MGCVRWNITVRIHQGGLFKFMDWNKRVRIHQGGLFKFMDWNKRVLPLRAVIIGSQLYMSDHKFSPWTENNPWIWNKPPL